MGPAPSMMRRWISPSARSGSISGRVWRVQPTASVLRPDRSPGLGGSGLQVEWIHHGLSAALEVEGQLIPTALRSVQDRDDLFAGEVADDPALGHFQFLLDDNH